MTPPRICPRCGSRGTWLASGCLACGHEQESTRDDTLAADRAAFRDAGRKPGPKPGPPIFDPPWWED